MKKVLVEWLDHMHTSRDGWYTLEEARSLRAGLHKSVGFLIDDNDEVVILAGSWHPGGQIVDRDITDDECVNHLLVLLKTSVLSVKELIERKTWAPKRKES